MRFGPTEVCCLVVATKVYGANCEPNDSTNMRTWLMRNYGTPLIFAVQISKPTTLFPPVVLNTPADTPTAALFTFPFSYYIKHRLSMSN